MITRCPKCDTSFRITTAQLETAKGAVRCGSCLQIFQATEHIVEESAEKRATANKPQPNKPVTAPAQPSAKATPKPQAAQVKPAQTQPTQAQPKPAVKTAPAPQPKTQEPKPQVAASATQKPEPAKPSTKPQAAPTEKKAEPKPALTKTTTDASGTEVEEEITLKTPVKNQAASPAPQPKPAPIKPEPVKPANPAAQSPAKAASTGAQKTAPAPATEAKQDEEDAPIKDSAGQQNMLVFDQSAIDNDDLDSPLFDDDILISDETPLPDGEDDDEEDARPKGMDFDGDFSESFLNLNKNKTKEGSLFDHEARSVRDDDDDDLEAQDESWAMDLLSDEDDEAEEPTQNTKKGPSAPSGKSIEQAIASNAQAASDKLEDLDEFEFSADNTGTFDDSDFDDVEDILGEPLSEAIEPSFDTMELDALEDTPDSEEFDGQEYQGSYDEYGDETYDDEDYDSSYFDDGDRASLLSNIEPEPVDLGGVDKEARKRWLWRGGVAAGLLFLAIQVAWLQFDHLGRKAPYRGWYAGICSVIGCDLPVINDPSKIRATNLVVRDHPTTADALVVDTVLLNTAEFSQPFPELLLVFSNSNNQVVASRRFSANEYLAGELAGQRNPLMPVAQPVHFTIEIVNPGADAVSYQVYIL